MKSRKSSMPWKTPGEIAVLMEDELDLSGPDDGAASEPGALEDEVPEPGVPEDEKPEEDKPNKITRVVDTVLKAAGHEGTIGDAALKAFLFLVSLVLHSALSKSVSARLLTPGRGAKASALMRRRRWRKMIKNGRLKGEEAAAAEEAMRREDEIADAIDARDEAGVEDERLIELTSSSCELQEEATQLNEASTPMPIATEIEKVNKLCNSLEDVLEDAADSGPSNEPSSGLA